MSHGSVIPTATFTTLLENELVLVEKEKEIIGEVVTLTSNEVSLFWRSMEVTILSERLKRLSFFLSVSKFNSLPCFLLRVLCPQLVPKIYSIDTYSKSFFPLSNVVVHCKRKTLSFEVVFCSVTICIRKKISLRSLKLLLQ